MSLRFNAVECEVSGPHDHLASTAAAVIVVVVVVVAVVSRFLALALLAAQPDSGRGGDGALRERSRPGCASRPATVRDDHGDTGAHVAAYGRASSFTGPCERSGRSRPFGSWSPGSQ